jgi:hypothetical protein
MKQNAQSENLGPRSRLIKHNILIITLLPSGSSNWKDWPALPPTEHKALEF